MPPYILIGFQCRDHHLQGTFLVALRRGNLLHDGLHERLEVIRIILHVIFGNAVPCRRIDDGELELVIIRIQLDEELQDFVIDVIHPLVRPVNLVDDDNGLEFLLQGLAQDVFCLGHGPFKGIHQKKHAVHHIEDALHLPAEIRMARRIDNIDFRSIIENGCILRQNRNAPLTLKVAGIHDAFLYLLVRSEHMALLQHRIHKGRLAVIDMGNDCNIPQIFFRCHLNGSSPQEKARKQPYRYSLPAPKQRHRMYLQLFCDTTILL